jgi:hypothetical protein
MPDPKQEQVATSWLRACDAPDLGARDLPLRKERQAVCDACMRADVPGATAGYLPDLRGTMMGAFEETVCGFRQQGWD